MVGNEDGIDGSVNKERGEVEVLGYLTQSCSGDDGNGTETKRKINRDVCGHEIG